jgi:regulator of protease activity HflC (stomatin/prohibitin superfamily)
MWTTRVKEAKSRMKGTTTVQGFFRVVTWLVVLVLVGLLLFLPSLLVTIAGFSRWGPRRQLSQIVLLLIEGVLLLWLPSVIARMIYVLPEWQRMALLRLGRFVGVKGPGLFIVPPFLYSVASIVDMRITTHQVEATATLTKDNVPTKVTAAIEFEIEDPEKATIRVRDYLQTVIWASTEALKNTIGGLELRELLSQRERIATELESAIDQTATDFGVNVRAVRITDIDTPPALVEELAVIARAERGARAKQIQAEAEVKVAEMLVQAAKILEAEPGAIEVRQIQALLEMSKEESATIIVYPVDSFSGQMIAAATAGGTASSVRTSRQ